MPALPSPGAIIKAGWKFGLPAGESLAQVAMHFAYSAGPPLLADAVALANDFMSASSTHIAPLMANEIVLADVEVTDLSSSTGVVGNATGSTIPGTRGSSDIVSPICATTRYAVDRRFRGGHPKSYWPFGVSGDLGSFNQWSTGFIGDVDAAIPALITECLGFSHGGVAITSWVCVSYFSGFTVFHEPSGRARNIPTLRATPLVDPMSYIGLMPQYGVQKRRRGRV